MPRQNPGRIGRWLAVAVGWRVHQRDRGWLQGAHLRPALYSDRGEEADIAPPRGMT